MVGREGLLVSWWCLLGASRMNLAVEIAGSVMSEQAAGTDQRGGYTHCRRLTPWPSDSLVPPLFQERGNHQ